MRLRLWSVVPIALSGALGAQRTAGDAAAEFAGLRTDLIEARRDALAEAGKESFDPFSAERELLPRFQAAAKNYAGTDGAVPFLAWLAVTGECIGERSAAISLDTLMLEHLKSPALTPAITAIDALRGALGKDRARELLTRIAKDNADPTIQAQAFRARAQLSEGDARDADLDKAKELDSEFEGRTDRGVIDPAFLAIGAEAPEIIGEDLDGALFRLSDYRGKVVFLDFWGDW